MKGRPAAGEYAEYYAKYVDLVPGEAIIEELERQRDDVFLFLRSIPPQLEQHRYGEGKWSIREVVGHVSDAERVFSYRMLSFGRADRQELPGFDQGDWMGGAGFDQWPLSELTDELEHVRGATLALVRHFPPEAWERQGVASGFPVSVRALAFIAAGHMRHHMNVLRERYLR